MVVGFAAAAAAAYDGKRLKGSQRGSASRLTSVRVGHIVKPQSTVSGEQPHGGRDSDLNRLYRGWLRSGSCGNATGTARSGC